MKNLNGILCELLSCGYLDLQFLDELLGAYYLDLDLEEINSTYGKIDNINILIYEAYEKIKNMFLEENENDIKALGVETEDFEACEDYEIFTNYLDSHLCFHNEQVDNIYQNWRKR